MLQSEPQPRKERSSSVASSTSSLHDFLVDTKGLVSIAELLDDPTSAKQSIKALLKMPMVRKALNLWGGFPFRALQHYQSKLSIHELLLQPSSEATGCNSVPVWVKEEGWQARRVSSHKNNVKLTLCDLLQSDSVTSAEWFSVGEAIQGYIWILRMHQI